MPKADSNPITPDPVFAAIETAVQKHDAFIAALDAGDGISSDHPQWLRNMVRATESLADQCCKEDWAAIENIAGCKPSTISGVAASLRFFEARMGRDGINSREMMESLLGNMATALDRAEAERTS